MTKSIVIAVALLGLAVGAQAATIGYWDAAAPGAAPGTTFEGIVNNYDFTNNGATHNPGGNYYDFSGSNQMLGSGNEDLYDFPTDAGDGAGNGEARIQSPT